MEYKKINIVEPKLEQLEEGVITIESSQLINMKENDGCYFALRNGGDLRNKAVFLSSNIRGKLVDWVIVQDNIGNICAVPFTEKG